jgi:hypothetical protein
MAITTDTTTLPGYTILSDSITGGIAVISNTPNDSTLPAYSIANEIADKLTIIASRLESISNSLSSINNLAEGAGIHTQGPQDWIGLISTYKLYVENAGPDRMSLTEFREYFEKVNSLPKAF